MPSARRAPSICRRAISEPSGLVLSNRMRFGWIVMAGLVPAIDFLLDLRRGCPRRRRSEATPFFEGHARA